MRSKRSRNLFKCYWALGIIFVTLSLMPVVFCAIASANDINSVSDNYISYNFSSDFNLYTDIQLANSISNDDISNNIWQQAQTAVQNRYRTHDIFSFVDNMDVEQSFDLLLQLWKLVTYYYYHDIDQSTMVKNALVELQIAAESDVIKQRYHLSEDNSSYLVSEIQILIDKLKNKDEIDYAWLKIELEKISNCCKKIGLENSWPVLEIIFGICDNLDIYSNYLLPQRYFDMLDALNGSYKGIGVDIIFRDDNYPLVFDVVDNSPAAKAGIKPGDLLIELDNNSLKNIAEYQYDNCYLLADDDNFSMKIKRDDKTFEFALKKDNVTALDVRNVQTLINATTGFIRISSFGRNTASQVDNALKQLIEQGAESVIIDLRNNGGGMVSSAIETADLFIKEGKIVSLKSYSGIKTYIAGTDNKQTEDMSVVILVNKDTASAAEIFTAALKQHNRAIVIGKTTYGKAVVQTVYDLEHNAGALVLTTAEYFPPSGESFNKTGIKPNIEVVNTENADINEQNQSITDRISESNLDIRTALKCLSN